MQGDPSLLYDFLLPLVKHVLTRQLSLLLTYYVGGLKL